MENSSSFSSTLEVLPPQHQVFINFRGEDVRLGFVSHLVNALETEKIKVFVDNYADKGEPLESLFTKIEESKIALTIFSIKYTESIWCLRELTKINNCVEEGKLMAIPIFYKVDASTVKKLEGYLGTEFNKHPKNDERKKWKKALRAILQNFGIPVHEKRY